MAQSKKKTIQKKNVKSAKVSAKKSVAKPAKKAVKTAVKTVKKAVKKAVKAVKKVAEKQTYNAQLTTDLGKYLGTKVDIQKTAKGGKLVIEFYSEEELGRLYHQILGEVGE